jgi:hypothetical protein
MEPPVVDALIPPVVDIPSYDPPIIELPTYDPPVSAPVTGAGGGTEELEEEASAETERQGVKPPEVPPIPTILPPRPEIELPFVGDVPLPYTSEVMLAGTTAIGATAAALLGKSMVEQLLKIMKPIAKKMWLKLKAAMGKKFTDYELQQYFNFEGQKAVTKLLAKEQKVEKKRQLAEHLEQHQNKRPRKAKKDGK